MDPYSSSPGFYRLSEELLVMITEQVCPYGSGESQTLKSMRLATPRFAYLGKLLSVLFRHVRLVASPDRTDAIANMDWSNLAPHMRSLVFDPGRYSWAMTWDVVAPIIKDCVLRNNLPRICGDRGASVWELRNASSDQLIAKYCPADSLVDMAELRKHYEDYMARAEDVRWLYKSGRLRAVWTQCLRSLPRIDRFILGRWEYDVPTSAEDLHHTFTAHTHDQWHRRNDCHALQSVVVKELSKTVFRVISDAKAQVRWLCIDSVMSSAFTWVNDGCLGSIDLSRLSHLRFAPQTEEPEDSWSGARKERVERRCSVALNDILKRCSANLEALVLGSDHGVQPTHFPMDDAPTLPSLTALDVSGCVRLRMIARLIAQSSSLKAIRFDMISGTDGVWRQVLRAIRYHENRMMVRFNCAWVDEYTPFDLNHHTGSELLEPTSRDDLETSLANYVSNQAKWNAICRVRIEGDVPELGTTSDEDDLYSSSESDVEE